VRTTEGVGFEDLSALGLTPDADPVRLYAGLDLIETHGGRLTATAAGRLVLDRLIAELAG
jgi:oxygen-independent coproporphyrinogen-3 oxidase